MVTKSILKQYRYILKENTDLERRIENIKKQLEKLETEGNVVDKVSGGEGGKQHFRIEGFPVAEYSTKKTRLLSQMLRYEHNLKFIEESEKEVCEFINGIPDSRARMIFRFYYEDGMSQQSIALKLHIDQSLVSKEVDKYLCKLS